MKPVMGLRRPMWKETMAMRAWAVANVPMISYVRPKVVRMSQQEVAVKIPLTRRTRNHLKSMYFGALNVGADLAGGFMALRHAQASGKKISFVFKDSQAQYLRRAEDDVVFTCEAGDAIRALVDRAIRTGERHELPVAIIATCNDEVVARFTLTLSLRAKQEA